MMDLRKYRREFHKYPEAGWHEFRTSSRIGEILTEIGYDVLMGPDVVLADSIGQPSKLTKEETRIEMDRAVKEGANPKFVEMTKGYPGVIAILDTGIEGPVTAFRFDIDCLPYEEPAKAGFRPFDEGYISTRPGLVHACGHDGHMAIGLGIAKGIKDNKEKYKGKIKLIFQPAEETFYGAQSVVDKGHFDDVNNFISIHLALSGDNKPLTSNTMACGCKDFLSVRQIDVNFEGKAAHPCGAAQEGKNALLAACSAALMLHGIAKHEEGMTSVNVGELHGGVCSNTIAPNAVMTVEYRGEKPNISKYMEERVFEILDGAAKAYGVTYTFVDYGDTPAGASDDEMMEIIQRAAQKVPWFKKIYFEGNVGGSDDATVMLTKVQENGGIGTYLGIGTNTTMPVHNGEFDFDEDCMEPAVQMCINALDEIHVMDK